MEFNPDLKYRKLPTVVLAGRPNVGKSTLFNRLLHQRRAITDPTPGVTRDPVGMDTFIAGKPLHLVDTGGFKLDRKANGGRDVPEDALDDLVVEKTMAALESADLILLILEAGELTLEDEEFIALLRPYQNKLLALVNKTEGGRRENESWNILSYGFDKVMMISAEHGDNVGELEEAIVGALDFSKVEEDDPDKRPIRIAILGKPNTGKSTLSNRLTASGASIVSDIPGTTRDVVEGVFRYKNRDFQVLDTAGIRRRSKVTENIEYYSVNRAIKTLDDADIVFLLIDAQEGLSDQDKKIAALIDDRGRGVVMVLNKWDTMPDLKNTFTAVQDRIHFLFGQMEYAPIVPVSALDGAGVDTLLDTAIKVYAQLNLHTDTGPLNQALERWLTESPPPSGPQNRFKLKYAVQVSDNPVRFVIFASRPKAVSESYISYLRNKLRRDLGYSLIPLGVEIRLSAKNDPAKKNASAKGSPRRGAKPGLSKAHAKSSRSRAQAEKPPRSKAQAESAQAKSAGPKAPVKPARSKGS
ncbi:ribosome-associated GTPase EngA [Treponema primitia ZAS-2]|uniref:GTPase Der n=1 Tax=Treponema primitia (strain ATCC BAA-887 / DSM 12427 / ZAS-2) TaxID=545694 RepID=F5YLP3_TREPZ|nr:ribosome biogenesis GTPase Der [Treponema primitia]AEF84966.1 ribosome-associated GTPase EngA [Treponema primitia ZAS-2]